MVIKIKGILDFEVEDMTRKHKSQSSWKRVAIIKTNCDLYKYYAWFLKKRFNLELNDNLRGTHISFINDKMDRTTFDEASKIFHGREIEFYIELEPRSNIKHWWLRVHCPEAESIREVMGLTRDPYHAFHLSLGHAVLKYPEDRHADLTIKDKDIEYSDNSMKAKKDYLEHSEYILRQCQTFEIISNEPRKPLSEHDIIEFK